MSMGHVDTSTLNQDRCLGFPLPFIPCMQDKEENFKLSSLKGGWQNIILVELL